MEKASMTIQEKDQSEICSYRFNLKPWRYKRCSSKTRFSF